MIGITIPWYIAFAAVILSKGIIFRNSFNLPQAFLYLPRMRAVDVLLSYMLITAHKTWLLDDFPKEAKNSRKKLRKVNLCQFSYVLLSRFLFSRFHQESYGNVSSVILDLTLCKLKFFYVQMTSVVHSYFFIFVFAEGKRILTLTLILTIIPKLTLTLILTIILKLTLILTPIHNRWIASSIYQISWPFHSHFE